MKISEVSKKNTFQFCLLSALLFSRHALACDFCMLNQDSPPELTGQARGITLGVNSLMSDHSYDHTREVESQGKKEAWLTYSLTAFTPVTNDLTVQLTVPYSVKSNIDFDDSSSLNTGTVTSGLGDLALSGRYRLLQSPQAQSAWLLTFLGGIKLPTGSTSAVDRSGRPIDRHALPGTGSWDFDLGFSASYTTDSGLKLALENVYRMTTTGKWADRNHRFGNSFNYSIRAYEPVAKTSAGSELSPFLGLVGDTTGMERGAIDPTTSIYNTNLENRSTGGTVLFAQLGINANLNINTILNLSVSKAFYRNVNFDSAFDADPVENYKLDLSISYLF